MGFPPDTSAGFLIAKQFGKTWTSKGITPLVAFYDIYGRKREGLVFYSVPDTTQD
jgi:hypothetical protein